MENNSWLIRPEEEVVSAHVLLTFDVRLQRCQLLLLWKKCIEQCVQVQQCPDDRNASFRRLWLSRCLSSHCENLSFLTKQIFYFSFSKKKRSRITTFGNIFISLTSCDLFVIKANLSKPIFCQVGDAGIVQRSPLKHNGRDSRYKDSPLPVRRYISRRSFFSVMLL